MYTYNCKNCGKEVTKKKKGQKYCSIGCRMVAPGKDMVGEVHGWLTIIEELERKYDKRNIPERQFRCQCKCGNVVTKTYDGIKNKGYKTPSCGCFMHWHATNRIKHGMTHTSIYHVWAGLKSRCYKKNVKSYKNYGAKGIKVCDRWLNSFENFYEDMSATYKEGLTLDRFPNQKGDYEPNNCRWATYFQQMRNVSTNRMITVGEYTKCVSEFTEVLCYPKGLINGRLRLGWSDEDAVLGTMLKKKCKIIREYKNIKEYYESNKRENTNSH